MNETPTPQASLLTAEAGAPLGSSPTDTWPWHAGYAQLGPAFFSRQPPSPLPAPYWVAHSLSTAQALGLSPQWLASAQALDALAGNAVLPGSDPMATVYSGHQFGQWAGQLGDGRALLLGELLGAGPGAQQHAAKGWELQLKGAGRTPYSRMGDGRAVLRSSIREFLCSEAMVGLGIPTTLALALVGSPGVVRRETLETAAVVTRAAPSFIRFGHFEHFAHHDMHGELQVLADYVIDRYYPACRQPVGLGGNPYAALLQAVSERTAALLAQWQAVGFCHGVMNTDNMSILGLTIDYGPFQFLDAFRPGHICNHSDNQGRYAFNRQPQVAYWNLYCLGQALLPLIEDTELATAALESYKTVFPACMLSQLRAKLGLPDAQDGDGELADTLMTLLARQGVDYPIFWRRLSEGMAQQQWQPVRDLMPDRAAFDAWMLQFEERIRHTDKAIAAKNMLKTNPRIVLRNHLAETCIQAARQGDHEPLHTLHRMLLAPYDEHPGDAVHAGFPPDWADALEISCSS
jgi:serine/tyrosine/threonine adenylyltransferase